MQPAEVHADLVKDLQLIARGLFFRLYLDEVHDTEEGEDSKLRHLGDCKHILEEDDPD